MRTALFLCLLGLLAAAPAPARPRPHWGFWLVKPETHGSRKLAGDFTHARGSYHHRSARRGMFGFLHRSPRTGSLAHRPRPAHAPTPRPTHRRPMTLQ